jgi:hypothetical protein
LGRCAGRSTSSYEFHEVWHECGSVAGSGARSIGWRGVAEFIVAVQFQPSQALSERARSGRSNE